MTLNTFWIVHKLYCYSEMVLHTWTWNFSLILMIVIQSWRGVLCLIAYLYTYLFTYTTRKHDIYYYAYTYNLNNIHREYTHTSTLLIRMYDCQSVCLSVVCIYICLSDSIHYLKIHYETYIVIRYKGQRRAQGLLLN